MIAHVRRREPRKPSSRLDITRRARVCALAATMIDGGSR
jgi:hypothetical protein